MKKKLCVIVPSDALLFDGFMEAVELGWRNSVSKTIRVSISHFGKNELPKTADFVKAVNSGTLDAYIEKCTQAVLECREKAKLNSQSPLNILQRSYAVLKDFGFSSLAVAYMSDEIGNKAYLERYVEATQQTVSVSEEGVVFLQSLQQQMALGYDVELIRSEHKREVFVKRDGDEIRLMDAETAFIHAIVPDLKVTHCGMVPEGGAYIEPLQLAPNGHGFNVVVVPHAALSKRIVNEIHSEIIDPLAHAAQQGNLQVACIGFDGVEPSALVSLGKTGVPVDVIYPKMDEMAQIFAQLMRALQGPELDGPTL